MSVENLAVLAPCFYPNSAPYWRLVRSAQIHEIPLHCYGQGEQFTNWIDTHINRLYPELVVLLKNGKTHFLFTDSSDAFFLAGLNEIWLKYEMIGQPPIVAACEQSGLNAGGFMGMIEAMLDVLDMLSAIEKYNSSGDPQVRWRKFANDQIVRLDGNCNIFQTTAWDSHEKLERNNPCVFHVCGGYTDPVTYKSELLRPWWDRFYPQAVTA